MDGLLIAQRTNCLDITSSRLLGRTNFRGGSGISLSLEQFSALQWKYKIALSGHTDRHAGRGWHLDPYCPSLVGQAAGRLRVVALR